MGRQKTVSFRIDEEKVSALDTLAEAFDRDRTYLLNEAVSAYLDIHQWQIKEIQAALQQADAGNLIGHEEVKQKILTLRRHK